MKPLSERDENQARTLSKISNPPWVGMKPLSERDENERHGSTPTRDVQTVGMKPLSERDENLFNTNNILHKN